MKEAVKEELSWAEQSCLPAEPTNTRSLRLPRQRAFVLDSKCSGPSLGLRCGGWVSRWQDGTGASGGEWHLIWVLGGRTLKNQDAGRGTGVKKKKKKFLNKKCMMGICIWLHWGWLLRGHRAYTYLGSGHLVPGEFGTLRSVRRTRTSFGPRSRRTSLTPFQ